jgi:hypothetical protein
MWKGLHYSKHVILLYPPWQVSTVRKRMSFTRITDTGPNRIDTLHLSLDSSRAKSAVRSRHSSDCTNETGLEYPRTMLDLLFGHPLHNIRKTEISHFLAPVCSTGKFLYFSRKERTEQRVRQTDKGIFAFVRACARAHVCNVYTRIGRKTDTDRQSDRQTDRQTDRHTAHV